MVNSKRRAWTVRWLAQCGSVATLALAASGAWAQSAPATPPTDKEGDQTTAGSDIIVTGSRIRSGGFDQPTPVTAVSSDQLSLNSPRSLSESLAPLPQLRLSTNPQGGQTASGNMGAISQLNLRGLGANRTLVLLNGHRLTPANTGSAPDINMLPQQLIKRVEIVTGGASAAYGSDAVSGVVNFILDDKLRGLKLEAQTGITERGDAESQRVGAAFGVHLLDNRLHLIASAEYMKRGGAQGTPDRKWTQGQYLPLTNPAVTATNPASPTNPNFIIAPNSAVANGTPGGLITSGPLANIEFINGRPDPFVGGTLRTAGFMQGGDGVWPGNVTAIALPLERHLEFGQVGFDITDAIQLYASASYGHQTSPSLTQITSQTFTIFAGNPYIPAGLNVGTLASFPLSKFNLDVGGSKVVDTGSNREFNVGLKGTVKLAGSPWAFDLSYQNGQSTYSRTLLNNINQVNVYNAADSVVVTAANRGTSGLALNSIVCRTTLTQPGNGCVPINPFIPLSENSQAASDYVFFQAFFNQRIKQQSAQANISGRLFEGWAGPISAAVGAEYRNIKTTVTSDALSQTLPATYISATAAGIRGLPAAVNTPSAGVGAFGNFQPLAGGFDVREGFVEVNAPVLRDVPFIRSLELNGAYRYTNYSTSGGVSTWKVGAVWDVATILRFRATRSRDIRAPNVVELLQPRRQQGVTVTDPALGNAAFATNRFDQGNPNLSPEIADTLTFGAVFRPTAASGLRASIDAYDIKIRDAIVLLIAQDVVSGCYNGAPEYCALITRTNNSPTGTITAISTNYFNGQQIRQRGIDFEISYQTRLAGGGVVLRALANYVDEYSLTQRPGLPKIDKAGEVGAPTSGSAGVFGVPHWSGTATATYTKAGFTGFLQGRYVGGGKYDNTYNTDRYNVPGQAITYINDNDIRARFYLDLTLRQAIGGANSPFQLSATVTNLFDTDPPIDPSRASTLPFQTNGFLYDTLGRQFSFGFSARF